MPSGLRPSDFPRDDMFRDPHTPPFRDEHGVYHVFSYDDVMRALINADRAFTRDASAWLPPDVHHLAFDFMWLLEPFTIDGEPGRHDALRGVVEPWFRTRAVRTMEPVIRDLARELINDIVKKGTGELDLARELGYRLSMRVICRLIGLEVEREQWLREKIDELNQSASFADVPRQWDLEAYLWSVVAKRLARPRDELLDVLLTSWDDGAISDRELLGYIGGFVLAGTDTTGTSLVNGISLLAEFGYVEQVRKRLDDSDAMRRTVEEILRFGNTFPMKPLFVIKDVTFGGLAIPAGSILNIWYVAANRDEAVNGGAEQADPAVFDPSRWPNRHLGLGHGRHYCLGGELARLETRVLLEEALRRLPGLRLHEAKPFRRVAGIVDGVTEAPFRFDLPDAARIMGSDASAAPTLTPATVGEQRDA